MIKQKKESNYNCSISESEYKHIHNWINKNKKKPKACIHCKKIERIEWANINHKYRKNLNDYIPLCRSCHLKYDYKNNKVTKEKECYFCKKKFKSEKLRYCSKLCEGRAHYIRKRLYNDIIKIQIGTQKILKRFNKYNK